MLRQTMILTETILKIQVAYTPQNFPSQLNTVNEMPGTNRQPRLPALWLPNVKGTLRSATIFVFLIVQPWSKSPFRRVARCRRENLKAGSRLE